jgi:hypothetical protein
MAIRFGKSVADIPTTAGTSQPLQCVKIVDKRFQNSFEMNCLFLNGGWEVNYIGGSGNAKLFLDLVAEIRFQNR